MKQCINCSHFDLHENVWCCSATMKVITRNINGKIEDKKLIRMKRDNCPDYNEEGNKERVKELKTKTK